MTGTRATFLFLLTIGVFATNTAWGQRWPQWDWSRAPRWLNPNANNNNGNSAAVPANPWILNNRGQNAPNPNLGSANRSAVSEAVNRSGNDPLMQSMSEQFQRLNQKVAQLDLDNQQLVTDLATTKQKLQAANDYNYQLKRQLTDTIAQLQQWQVEKANWQQQLATQELKVTQMAAANPPPGQLPNATLRANNSLLQKVSLIQLPGVTTRMDGDVIRVEIPSDALFVPNSYQVDAQYGQVLQQVAASIARNFSEQIVGIEAHWDQTQLQPPATAHQLTASQALSVLDYLTRSGLPERQMFTMAVGSNRLRYPPNAAAGNPNRRIEVVIYPESFSGR